MPLSGQTGDINAPFFSIHSLSYCCDSIIGRTCLGPSPPPLERFWIFCQQLSHFWLHCLSPPASETCSGSFSRHLLQPWPSGLAAAAFTRSSKHQMPTPCLWSIHSASRVSSLQAPVAAKLRSGSKTRDEKKQEDLWGCRTRLGRLATKEWLVETA